ncbi:SDR family oxidoreductase [Stenotrophomonas sp. 24(2023)]|uniref:SDR family oxidoreductase n=1 Tax=Stenotrophomonas sp. 24(2023) TaxID=3068324 RepID=UPI0027E2148A|nr:SDR family oxidoreductase [Stenotrophomonas sp. 24(2023)]WMJ70848.1 SDR family oxidoreductase [Stenotrophomonas sp. 24(2023)]
MKTVLITGCSSGYGLATAAHFLAQGWQVIATARTPRSDLLPPSPQLRVLPLDVTDAASIDAAIAAAGPIDVLVNNAGIGLFGAFEATPMATVREVFETNTFGVMALCQAVIPAFRERGAGCIINVTSSATLAPFPLVAAYTASKTAVEGFTASLAHELRSVGVQAKLVEPGYGPGTRFTANGQERMQGLVTAPYRDFAAQIFAGMGQLTAVTQPQDVAEAVWQAAHDDSGRLHFPAGADALALAAQPRQG